MILKMKYEDRLVNAVIDLHQEITGMRVDMNKKFDILTDRVEKVEEGILKVEERIVKVEGQMIIVNKAIGELRLSVMKLAEQTRKFSDHDRRLRKVETTLAKNKLL